MQWTGRSYHPVVEVDRKIGQVCARAWETRAVVGGGWQLCSAVALALERAGQAGPGVSGYCNP